MFCINTIIYNIFIQEFFEVKDSLQPLDEGFQRKNLEQMEH